MGVKSQHALHASRFKWYVDVLLEVLEPSLSTVLLLFRAVTVESFVNSVHFGLAELVYRLDWRCSSRLEVSSACLFVVVVAAREVTVVLFGVVVVFVFVVAARKVTVVLFGVVGVVGVVDDEAELLLRLESLI